jgi:hypothetical protein
MFGRLLAGHMYAFELRATVRRRAFTYTVPSFSVVTFAGTLEKSATCHYGRNTVEADGDKGQVELCR